MGLLVKNIVFVRALAEHMDNNSLVTKATLGNHFLSIQGTSHCDFSSFVLEDLTKLFGELVCWGVKVLNMPFFLPRHYPQPLDAQFDLGLRHASVLYLHAKVS